MQCIICDKEIGTGGTLFITLDKRSFMGTCVCFQRIMICEDCLKKVKAQLDSPLLFMLKDLLIKKGLYESLFNK